LSQFHNLSNIHGLISNSIGCRIGLAKLFSSLKSKYHKNFRLSGTIVHSCMVFNLYSTINMKINSLIADLETTLGLLLLLLLEARGSRPDFIKLKIIFSIRLIKGPIWQYSTCLYISHAYTEKAEKQL